MLHGSSLAFPSHALRYGVRTMSGSMGGVNVEAYTAFVRNAATAAAIQGAVRYIAPCLTIENGAI
jgi:hypothetical protein